MSHLLDPQGEWCDANVTPAGPAKSARMAFSRRSACTAASAACGGISYTGTLRWPSDQSRDAQSI
eukprot:4319039-Pyramimonas_sp.AAC.1